MKQIIVAAELSHLVDKDEIKTLEVRNVSFKNKLAAVLMLDTHKEQLDYFEYFQNRFLQLDEKIGQLKLDLKLFDTPLLYPLTPQLTGNIRMMADNIKASYDKLTLETAHLEKEFNNFLQNKRPHQATGWL